MIFRSNFRILENKRELSVTIQSLIEMLKDKELLASPEKISCVFCLVLTESNKPHRIRTLFGCVCFSGCFDEWISINSHS